MAFISKFEGSLFSAKNDNTLAFATANVDFSLIKVEVPKNYEGLGLVLSRQRINNAENGPLHRTARRLGALFEQIIPNIDALAAAYGERVSEIATSSKLKSKTKEYGPFSEHVGVDGTSIYAAASSGSNVIALHLLACMLARMFSNAEATAIWTQIVECRIRDIETNSDATQLQGLAARCAADHGRQMTRDDLAAWDASARAWLDVANQVKRQEDTQLKLIIKNIPSVTKADTYANVVENWVVALTTVQKIIQGVPQDISNGSVLLGLMSWHIYPDLNVFCPVRYVRFGDPLVKPGGIITLGLEYQGREGVGVSWSLSLSHLRFYGAPVVLQKSSREDSDRLTVQELRFVAFGCILSTWASPASIIVNDAATCFVALGKCLNLDTTSSRSSHDAPLGWLVPLVEAAKDYLSAADEERNSARYFVEFGRRCGSKLLDDNSADRLPMFGLVNPLLLQRFSGSLTNATDNEASITILRELAKDCGFHRGDTVIVSRPSSSKHLLAHHDSARYLRNVELASAIEFPIPTGKRLLNGEARTTSRHKRWIHIDRTEDPALQRYLDCMESGNPIPIFHSGVHGWLPEGHMASSVECDCSRNNRRCDENCSCRMRGFKCTSICPCVSEFTGFASSRSCSNIRVCRPEVGEVDEDCSWLSVRSTKDMTSVGRSMLRWHEPPVSFVERYEELRSKSLGDPAISHGLSNEVVDPFDIMNFQNGYIDADSDSDNGYDPDRVNSIGLCIRFQPVVTGNSTGLYLSDRSEVNIPELTLRRVTSELQSGTLVGEALSTYLAEIPFHGVTDCSTSLEGKPQYDQMLFTSLKALAVISELYCDWPEATIPISITKQPLGRAYWTTLLGKENQNSAASPHVLRSIKFSCLAMLESGGHDIHPSQLEQVMALAAGNSIFAAEALLQDPLQEDRSGQPGFRGIQRVVGSLGYPGVVMLVPPPSPMVYSVDSCTRGLLQAENFDGKSRDFFGNTSLHLRFTKLAIPLASAKGAIDADVVMREALIQVYDGGRWIADLDVLRTLASPNLVRLQGCECEKNEDTGNLGQSLVGQFADQIKSIEKWEELLISDKNLIVGEIGAVRTYGNWYARLGATALATGMDCPTVILPSHCICSECSERLVKGRPWVRLQKNRYPELLVI
ncbi:hypothetical protein BDV96DRAFT_520274 [Lophiotrema nucula]|uniref:Uncharacterized protein n=1 Tax=Lophiotrema nucula TaxID=690887 RepID=A0A6A5Z9K5_9PLEO|nr:hypothetical protein BDV96DRAFT_520274 [Lophiotrema nucula]